MLKWVNLNIIIPIAVLSFLGLAGTGTLNAEEGNGLGETSIQNYEHRRGSIDRIGAGEMVINDALYKLTNYTVYLSESGNHVSKATFKVGDSVACLVNQKNEITRIQKR